jgi:hypothetical protein
MYHGNLEIIGSLDIVTKKSIARQWIVKTRFAATIVLGGIKALP